MLVMLDISADDGRMSRDLDIGLLRAFLVVADRNSITAAAKALHLTQGAVSQRIARLEDLSGGPLLARERPRLRLTPAGERLLGRARRLVALNDEVWMDFKGRALAGPLRLGASHDLLASRFSPTLKSFAEACPDVELSLNSASSAELLRDLAKGLLDLAVVEEPLGTETGEILDVDRLVWVGARGGVAHHRKPLPVSIIGDLCVFKPAMLAALADRDGGWRTVFENGGMEGAFATVRADLAVSAWLARTVPSDLETLPPEAGLPVMPPFAVTLHGAGDLASPTARELARHIRHGFVRSLPP